MPSLAKDLAKTVWFLDYDGTLCPHLEVWEERQYRPDDIHAAVSWLARKAAGVFWNTGRRADSLGGVHPRFLDFPGYFVQGSTFWDAHQKALVKLGLDFPQEIILALQQRMENENHYRVEIKPTGGRIAALRKTQRKFLKKYIDALDLKISDDWEWRIGDRGAELLLKRCSKGSALEEAWASKRVPSDAIPIVAGDDFFDRAAMEFALARGGYAVLVGEGCGWITEIPHRSSQVIYFREPRDFLMFLKGL